MLRQISPHELVMPNGNAPSIYASQEDWVAYHEEQARALAEQEASQANDAALAETLMQLANAKPQGTTLPPTGAGAGRGSINPPNVIPDPIEALSSGFSGKKDPLVADENGHNLERTDKVNTTGAMQRINAASPKWYPGVTATMQANGTLALSNVGSGAVAQTEAPRGPNVSNDLFSNINALKATSDPDSARGILANIRESAAQKSTALMTEAMNFASSKLGVPFLETQLREAEAADRADPQWYPGIGDSPITAKIRTSLLTTRSSVDNEAKNYLATNTTYASMNSALKTAEEEAKRIEAITARKEALTDRLTLNSELKKDAKIEEAETLRATLSPTEQKRLAILNPSIGNEADTDKQMLAMAATIKRAERDPAMREALGAADQDLPILAMAGNADALTLTASMEKENNPSATDESIKATLDMIARDAGKPMTKQKALRLRGITPGSKEEEAVKNEEAAAALSGNPASKPERRRMDMAEALAVYKAGATDRFLQNTGSWGITDPGFLAAQEEAIKTTGKSDMESVLTAYLKATENDPITSLKKVAAFKLMTSSVASRQAKSIFGTPDTVLMDAMITRAARTTGLWEAIKRVTSLSSTSNTSMAPLGILGAAAVGASNYMNN